MIQLLIFQLFYHNKCDRFAQAVLGSIIRTQNLCCYVNLLLHSPFKTFLHKCSLENIFPPLRVFNKYLGLLLARETLKIRMTVVSGLWTMKNKICSDFSHGPLISAMKTCLIKLLILHIKAAFRPGE